MAKEGATNKAPKTSGRETTAVGEAEPGASLSPQGEGTEGASSVSLADRRGLPSMVRLSPLVEEKSDNALIADLIAHVMSLEARLRREREGCHATGSITAGGAVLVFMPGRAEIEALVRELRHHSVVGDRNKVQILSLHSSLDSKQQRSVFRIPPSGITKVVVATNIAETSITIEDVSHVIDSGHVKEVRYDSSKYRPSWFASRMSRDFFFFGFSPTPRNTIYSNSALSIKAKVLF